MQCLLIEHIMKIMMLTGAMLIGMLTVAIFDGETHIKAHNWLTIPYTNVDECKVRTPIAHADNNT